MNHRIYALIFVVLVIGVGYRLLFSNNIQHIPRTTKLVAQTGEASIDDAALPHYKINCSILDLLGRTVFYIEGNRCLFLDNGDYVISQRDLKYFNKDGSQKWTLPIHGHHQIRMFNSHIYLLAYDYVPSKEYAFRYDAIYRISLDGKIKHRYNYSAEYIKELGKETLKLKRPYWIMSHANSISEIPRNNNPKNLRAFDEGNILISDTRLDRLTILDPFLQKRLYSLPIEHSDLHDAQVMPSGNILAYSNLNSDGNSEILYLDQTGKTIEVLKKGDDNFLFKAEGWGGVQNLPSGRYLFSNCRPTGPSFHIYDPFKEKVFDVLVGLYDGQDCIQEAQRVNLTKFLQSQL